jgi:hydrogenase expression/formation protein HypC
VRPDTDLGAHCHPGDGCITCSDEAVPMLVRRLDDDRGLALCEDATGRRETVEIALVTPVARGDRLLVHAGTAIARASADEVGCGDERSEAG